LDSQKFGCGALMYYYYKYLLFKTNLQS